MRSACGLVVAYIRSTLLSSRYVKVMIRVQLAHAFTISYGCRRQHSTCILKEDASYSGSVS